MRSTVIWIPFLALLGGCATTQPTGLVEAPQSETVVSRPAIACSDGKSTIDSDFAGSAMAGCQVMSEGHYRLQIRQEDRNVTNCSAWYAFRVQAAEQQNLIVELDYENCGHRYLPKLWIADEAEQYCESTETSERGGFFARLGRLISRQRRNCSTPPTDTPKGAASWDLLPADTYAVENSGEGDIPQARLAIEAGPRPRIVSSQELILPADYSRWLDSIESDGATRRTVLGKSLEGQPIEMIELPATDRSARGQLVLVGRQHPPEVTGALAMFAYVERLQEDDELAVRFRDRFTTSVVPLLNPDGVLRGHWRHSKGERDLNRDWGPFTQPETRLMRDLMESMEADPTRELRFFIDFHSTSRDILYTLDKSLATRPEGFTDAWVADYQGRLPGYAVVEQPGHNPELPVSKGWTFERFGIPSMTYEIGDETDRTLIRQLGRAAAEATMTTMLAYEQNGAE